MPDNNLPETTPLHQAAAGKYFHGLNLAQLLEQDADPSKKTKDGSLPIHVAAKYGASSYFKLLLAHRNFDINTKITNGAYAGYTPLHIALECRNFRCAELILQEKDVVVDEFALGLVSKNPSLYNMLKFKAKWPNYKVSDSINHYRGALTDIFLNMKALDTNYNLLSSDKDYTAFAELTKGFISHLENDEFEEQETDHLNFLQSLTEFVFYLDYSSEYKQQISDINYHLGTYLYHNADISDEPNSIPMLLLLLSYSERTEQQKSDILKFLDYSLAGIQITGGEQSKQDKLLSKKHAQDRQQHSAELIDTLIEQVLVGESPALIALGLISDALGGKNNARYKGYHDILRTYIRNGQKIEISDKFITKLKTNLDEENELTAINKLAILNKSLEANLVKNHKLTGSESLEILETKLAIRDPKGNRVFDPNFKNPDSFTPLLSAISMGNIDVAHRLLKLDDIDVNLASDEGKAALPELIIKASTNEHVNLAKELLAHPKLDLSIKSTEADLTLLQLARKHERTEIVDLFYQEPLKTKYQRMLIKNKKFDIIAQELKEYYFGHSKLLFKRELESLRCMMGSTKFESLAIKLLKNIGTHALDPSKHTLWDDKYDLIYHLLDITPNSINTPLADGLTLLHHAVNFKRIETVHLLLDKKGIDPNVVAGDTTPLHLAITKKFDNPAIPKYIVADLLAHGADAAIPLADGSLPFIKAASNNLPAVAAMLFKANPEVALNALKSLPGPQLVDLMVYRLGDIRSQLKNSNELEIIQQFDDVVADLILKPETTEALKSVIYSAIKNNDINKLRKIAKLGNVDFYCKLSDESIEGLRDFGRSAAYHAHLKGNTSLEYFLLEQTKDPVKKQQMIDDIMDADLFKTLLMTQKSIVSGLIKELRLLESKCHNSKWFTLHSFNQEFKKVDTTFLSDKKEYTPENVQQLTTDQQAIVEKHEDVLMKHHGIKYVIANIFLSLTVIGLVAIAIKAIHSKAKTGHATVFFKRSRTAEKLTELKNVLDELPNLYTSPSISA